MQDVKQYYIYQGKLGGKSCGKSKVVCASGPTAALKMFFPSAKYRRATQKEIWGSASRSNQFKMQNGQMMLKPNAGQSPNNWVQINRVDKDEATFFILEV